MRRCFVWLASLLACCSVAHAATAAKPPYGALQGRVAADAALGQLTVQAFDAARGVAYTVYVVDGRYRAAQMLPGDYDVAVRGTAGQKNADLRPQHATVRVEAGRTATVDFTVPTTPVPVTYVGGLPYPDARIEAYDTIYPSGRGRDVLERICLGCHTVQLFAYNAVRVYPAGRPLHDRAGWAATVERMSRGAAFGVKGKASMFDEKLLSAEDREALVDYLAKNFGPDAPKRVVRQDEEPALDRAALAKAQFVEFRFANVAGSPDRFVHTPDFDADGNVWIMDRGAQSFVRIDPRTGARRDFPGVGDSEYMTVDVDGTVWSSGLKHFDPVSGRMDEYRFAGEGGGRPIGASSFVLDRKGDLWLTLLVNGGIARYSRERDTVEWWDVPVQRSRPYGVVLDAQDRVWFADYHNSGLSRFDPKTGEFRHFALTPDGPTNIRRLVVDPQGFVWSGTWGSRAMRNGALYKLDPDSGRSIEYKLGIPFTNPYDFALGAGGSVWVATDNHLVRFDPRTERFTSYPVPVRTDIPKVAVTREGAVWFGPRNAGLAGAYGGAAAVLFPDKDRIEYGAYYSADNVRNRRAQYVGPTRAIVGAVKQVPATALNPGAYERALGLPAPAPAPASVSVGAGVAVAIPAAATGGASTPPRAVDSQLVARGRQLFVNCQTCHSVTRGGASGAGPNLWGVIGRRAASKPDFDYSEALRRSGIVWSDAQIERWLANPATFLEGNKMGFVGVPDATDRRAIVEYLHAVAAAD